MRDASRSRVRAIAHRVRSYKGGAGERIYAIDVLRLSASDLFEPDPSWGKHGWTHVHIADMDEAWVDRLLRDSWRRVTPKKLHGELDSAT